MDKKPTVLMILDGFGLSDEVEGNAVKAANIPNIEKLMKEYPFVDGKASGLDVGLPDGQMGNSEVGHLNIGAGRIVYQDLTRITKSIQDGDFFGKEEFIEAIENCKKYDSALHLLGLVSDGGVHSHIEHLYGCLELAKKNNLEKVFIHCFMDGRDTPPTSGVEYIEQLESKIKEIGVGKIATVSGRYYAMDRENRYERTKLAYDALTLGKGNQADSAAKCMHDSYEKEVNDEFIIPTVIMENGMPITTIKDNDSIIFFNFRADRARQITRAFCDDDFVGFDRDGGKIKNTFVCMTEYDVTIKNASVVYDPDVLTNTLGEYVSSLGLKQLRTAESTKYAHVTFFFNGGVEKENPGEDRVLVDSPKVATFDLKPEMSAEEVTDKLIESMNKKIYDLIIINYANPDMVGHTGIMKAAIEACEFVDKCVGRVYDTLLEVDGQMFVCADHGNLEKMIDKERNQPFTAHTTNPVPFILVNAKNNEDLRKGGRLCDIAPTLLDIMNLPIPDEMTGESLIIR